MQAEIAFSSNCKYVNASKNYYHEL